MVKKALNDYYIPTIPPAATAPLLYDRTDLKCRDFDITTGMCNSCYDDYYLNT
jgi:hypothetical protein